MFCSNGGTQLPDDANFCLKCGKPQGPHTAFEQPKWEICEIVEEEYPDPLNIIVGGIPGKFIAKAIGPNGPYIVKETAVVREIRDNRKNSKGQRVLNELIMQLVNDGWEPTTAKGRFWWSHSFQRRVK